MSFGRRQRGQYWSEGCDIDSMTLPFAIELIFFDGLLFMARIAKTYSYQR